MKNNRGITIYACGGAGAGIGKKLINLTDNFKKYICFADTSDSDIDKNIDKQHQFIFPVDVEGSGGIRKTNSAVIKDNIDNLIKACPPNDLNIVIASSSGGSGSVISPILVDKLKARGENVILFLITSTGSVLEVSNSFKTFESFFNVAKNNKSSIVTSVYPNRNGHTKDIMVDDNIINSICALYYLWTKDYKSLDTNDLNSWLTYSDKIDENHTLLELKINKYSIKDEEIAKNVENDLRKFNAIYSTLSLLPDGYNLEIPDNLLIRSNFHGFYDIDKIAEPHCYIHSIVVDNLYNVYKDIKNKAEKQEEQLKKQARYRDHVPEGDSLGLVL